MDIEIDTIPQELKEHPAWVNWIVGERNGKPTKIYQPQDYGAGRNPMIPPHGRHLTGCAALSDAKTDILQGLGSCELAFLWGRYR
jgi:hypothetical protein